MDADARAEQVNKAVSWVKSKMMFVDGQVGLVGWGFGANAVLATAVHHPDIFNAAVAYTPDIASTALANFTAGVSSRAAARGCSWLVLTLFTDGPSNPAAPDASWWLAANEAGLAVDRRGLGPVPSPSCLGGQHGRCGKPSTRNVRADVCTQGD
eukprot:3070489-Rhodomonas_salina.1